MLLFDYYINCGEVLLGVGRKSFFGRKLSRVIVSELRVPFR